MHARILLVEDNAGNLELMSYLLKAFGHVPTKAADGEAGLRLALDNTYDLVLTDVLMPRLDGYELLRRLRADPLNGSTKVVAVTALAMVGDRERILAAGFDGYVAKPLDPETFVRDIERFLPASVRSSGVPEGASEI
jgi:two-component system cell cycle response regulator